jgi:hypothetical protein
LAALSSRFQSAFRSAAASAWQHAVPDGATVDLIQVGALNACRSGAPSTGRPVDRSISSTATTYSRSVQCPATRLQIHPKRFRFARE